MEHNLRAPPPPETALTPNERLQLLSLKEVSILTNLGRTKVNEELRTKKLKSIKIGKRRLVALPDLKDWLEAQS